MFDAEVSQRDLAPQVGLSQSGLYRRLSGEVEWRGSELITIAAALGTTVDALVADVEVVKSERVA